VLRLKSSSSSVRDCSVVAGWLIVEKPMKKCSDSEFGCCPDGETAAPGPHRTGCPSTYFPVYT